MRQICKGLRDGLFDSDIYLLACGPAFEFIKIYEKSGEYDLNRQLRNPHCTEPRDISNFVQQACESQKIPGKVALEYTSRKNPS